MQKHYYKNEYPIHKWQEIFLKILSDKGQKFKIYKRHLKLNNKESNHKRREQEKKGIKRTTKTTPKLLTKWQ